MQGFRGALVVTGFVVLGLGSNLAWHYPRPVPLGVPTNTRQLVLESAALEQANIRCRPTADWSDLLVESAQLEEARNQSRNAEMARMVAANNETFSTPPDLLADLGRLPGVKQSNVWIHNEHEAVVTLAMSHGAFAGDPRLLQQVVDAVQAARPGLDPNNIKVLDERGSDLNYLQTDSPARPLRLQRELQELAEGTAGAKRALVFCSLSRAKDFRIHLKASLLLAHSAANQEALTAEIKRRLEKWTEALNNDLKGKNYWMAEAEIYPALGENDYRRQRERKLLDRDKGVALDELDVKEWTLRQRPLSQDFTRMACWGLTSPVPTPWQLGLGLAALGPAVFGWCLLLPRLLSRHRLGQASSASATL